MVWQNESIVIPLNKFTMPTHFPIIREKMAQAYDFALDKIGMEIMSYQACRSVSYWDVN